MKSSSAAQFGVPKRHIVNTLTATLLFRPVGAIIFGMLADRYGRRIPLMANVIYFSIIELLSGFSQTYTQFLTCVWSFYSGDLLIEKE